MSEPDWQKVARVLAAAVARHTDLHPIIRELEGWERGAAPTRVAEHTFRELDADAGDACAAAKVLEAEESRDVFRSADWATNRSLEEMTRRLNECQRRELELDPTHHVLVGPRLRGAHLVRVVETVSGRARAELLWPAGWRRTNLDFAFVLSQPAVRFIAVESGDDDGWGSLDWLPPDECLRALGALRCESVLDGEGAGQ
jgi:hypothetical protein